MKEEIIAIYQENYKDILAEIKEGILKAVADGQTSYSYFIPEAEDGFWYLLKNGHTDFSDLRWYYEFNTQTINFQWD